MVLYGRPSWDSGDQWAGQQFKNLAPVHASLLHGKIAMETGPARPKCVATPGRKRLRTAGSVAPKCLRAGLVSRENQPALIWSFVRNRLRTILW
jgi:hypothetical protein